MVRKSDLAAKGHVKLRIVEFELAGDDDTLHESLRTISSAINRATGITAPKRLDMLPGGSRVSQVVSEPAPVAPPDELEEPETLSDEPGRTVQSSTPRRRSPSMPEQVHVIADIDFNAAEVPLKRFMEEKRPRSHMMKSLVIAAWFKEFGGTEEITANHIHTAYLAMEWKNPLKFRNQFYDLKEKGWVKQTDGGWSITYTGVDKAKLLPAAE